VTILNSGGSNLTLSSLAITGLDSGSFNLSHNCSVLLPNQSCTASIVFAPPVSASFGPKSASLSIVSDATDSPTTMPLTGKTGVLYSFNELTGGASTSQAQTQLAMRYQATSSIWIAAGINSHHVLVRDAANKALMIFGFSTHSATLTTGIPANATGERFEVAFDVSPTVGNNLDQATSTADRLVVRAVDESGAILGQLSVAPGAWGGSNNFSKYSFTYIGNGTGLVKIVISSSVVTQKFAGAIDNLSIISKPDIVSAALSQGYERIISEPTIIGPTITIPSAEIGASGASSVSDLTSETAATRNSSQELEKSEGTSSSTDELTGSVYKVIHVVKPDLPDPQKWAVLYMDSAGTVLSSRALPDTSRIYWRAPAATSASTTGWVSVCSNSVYTFQDGYRLITHRFDKTLTAANQNEIEIARPAEVSLVTDTVCETGGSLTVFGFVFGVSDTEPPLSVDPVPAHRFEIELNRSGEVLRKTLTPAEFVLPAVCASPKKELIQFCTDVMTHRFLHRSGR